MLYVILGLVLTTLIATGIGGCEHKGKIAAQEKAAMIQGQYDAFKESTRIAGEEAKSKAKAELERQVKIDKEGKDALQKQITRLRADKSVVDRSLQHYIAAERSLSGRVPQVPSLAEGSGRDAPIGVDDELARLRAEVGELRPAFSACIKDLSTATSFFVSCRDRWKRIAGSEK